MQRCRCREVSQCQGEHSLLVGHVASSLSEAKSFSSKVSSKLREASWNFADSIYQKNIPGVEFDLNKLNDQQDQATSSLGDQCVFEEKRISELLRRMREEDRHYHNKLTSQQK